MNRLLRSSLLSLATGLFFSAPGEVGAEPETPVAEDPFYYIVAADPQLYFRQQDDAHWRTTIDAINRLRPDFLIVCGDLLNAPNAPEKWTQPDIQQRNEQQAAAIQQGIDRLHPEIRFYPVAGNHDVSARPTPETLAWYRQRFGAPWYHFEHKNSFFLVLESNLIRDPSGAPEAAAEQWAWLDQVLANSDKKSYTHKTAYMHHPLCLKSADEADNYFNIQQAPRNKLLQRFHAHGFSAVFCGHYHRNAHVRDGTLELVTTSSCGAPLGKDPLGFRLVRVGPHGLDHRYVGFDALPERLEEWPSGSTPPTDKTPPTAP